jgi:hypothetical protein
LGGGGTVLAASGPQRALKEAGKSSITMVHAPAGVALAEREFYGRELWKKNLKIATTSLNKTGMELL